MRKYALIIFISALVVGLMSVTNCSYGNLVGIQGSGDVESELRNVKDFKKISAAGAFILEIKNQENFEVEIQADDNLLSLIETEVSGNTLKISAKDRISPKNEIRIKISMPELSELNVSGASKAVVGNVKTYFLSLDASGASKITVNGNAENLKSNASGASQIEAENLQVSDAEVEASGASKIIVTAVNKLKAEASGASFVYYTIEPEHISKDSSGASSIEKK